MADNLIFPIGFDLEKGVKDVISRSDTYLRQIEHAMNRKPIVLRAEVDASKFQMFSRQFTNSIDGISAKLAQAQRLWNAMTFDVKFDADGNLSRRAQVVFDAFQQLTQASATMGQRLGEVNRNLAKSEQDTARAIAAEYDKRRQQVNEQIRLKEQQAAAEERVRQGQLKGVNVGYVETQKQVEAVRNLRLQYEAILPMLNAMAQRRYDIKVGIDKQFEADIQRINAEIARLRQSNLQLGAKGDTNAIQANLQAIRQLEAELQRISQQKIDLLNSNKINSDLARLRTEISSVFGELQSAERRLATDNSLNAALDAQSQKVLKLHADIQKLDQQFAQLNATGRAYNQDGSFTAQANTLLQQRIALTKQLEQEAITGQQAQIKLEQQLREEKRQTEQAAKNAAKEAERQAKAEAAARKQAQDAANAENKARQEAYNARRRQGQETQRILNKEAKSIADITAKLQIQQQRLQSANIGSAKFNKIAEEVRRLTADLEKANQKMRELTGQTQSGAARQSAAVKQVSQEFKNQETYVSRLIKRMAVYASFSAFGNFLTNVREVTAQFELQRISLGAIIQDQARANQLFAEIKSFALKSPVKILDLTKYTKQLAAYKIGVDELFETTKKLTDVSVGLGVSMDRVVLAYGQTRATGYLRASEIRQFTEMGVPIVEELATKLSKMNGELVTAAQVMDMVSKRGISFELVKEVFDDMTSAGGMFYNMQEKQAQTLFGMWSKLGDAAAVMYDEIGNTEGVNKRMKETIGLLESLMRNWRFVANEVMFAAIAFGVFKTASTVIKWMQVDTVAAHKAEQQLEAATLKMNNTVASGSKIMQLSAKRLRDIASWNLKAATSTNLLTVAWNKLKVAMATWGPMLIITALTTMVAWFISARQEANRLNKELSKMSAEGAANADAMVHNFERLANAVVESADGSKKQHEALEELKRTYSDIIPVQDLTVEKLRAMKGAYEDVAKAIREKVYQQNLERQISIIQEEYGGKISKGEKKTKELLASYGLDSNEIGRVMGAIDKAIDEGLITAEDDIKNRMAVIGKIVQDQTGKTIQTTEAIYKRVAGTNQQIFVGTRVTNAFNKLSNAITKIVKPTEQMNAKIKEQEEFTKGLTGTLGEYTNEWKRVQKEIADNKIIAGPKNSQFLVSKQNDNNTIRSWAASLKNVLGDAWDEAFVSLEESVGEKGDKMSYILFDKLMAPEVFDKLSIGQKNYIKRIQDEYNNLIPQDRTIASMRNALERIALQTGVSMDEMKRHLMNSGESWKDYSKRIRDSIKEYESEIDKMVKNNAAVAKGNGGSLKIYSDEEIKNAKDAAEVLKLLLQYLAAENGGGRAQSDPRLQNLKEEISLYEKLYQEYKQYEKAVGSSKAAEYMNREAKETIDALAKKYGIGLPKNVTDLTSAFEILYKKMQALPSNVFKNLDKELKEFRWKIEKVDIDDSQNKIEQQLEELSDRISRTKTAKEFYEKILGMTGDVELAANVTFSIYGEDGKDLKQALADQVRGMTKGFELPDNIISADNIIDYKTLRDWAKANEKELGGMYDKLIKISDDGQKELAKVAEQGAKLLLSYDEIAQQRVNIEQEASEKIRQLREAEALFLASQATEEQKEAYSKRIGEAVAGVEADRDLKLLKLKDEYMRFFSAIHSLTKKEAETLRGQVRQALFKAFQDGAISADELKRELKAIDEQFRKLTQDSGKFMDYLEGGFDGLINRLRTMADEMMSVGSEIGKMDSVDQISEGQKSFIDTMLKQFGNDATGNSFASLLSNTNGDLAEMGSLLQGISGEMGAMAEGGASALALVDRIITDVARTIEGIAAIRDQLNEMRSEDNQLEGGLWDAFEYLENFNKYAAQGWENLKSGNIVGAVQNTIQSIISIFGTAQAQRVRRANKEIKRQQELLDQLEYTYGRLEKAAERAFGSDYISNYNQRMRVLRAEQEAYLKQAEAERSKGKKKDKKKIKEYENQARDTADKIKELQDELVAHFTGSSRTDVARQMAKSWIDARASMSDTFAAIKGDYQDLIKNMIVEGAAARVIENALTPVWDSMEKMLAKNDVEGAIDSLVNGMDSALNAANNGMEVLWKALEERGYDMKQLISDTDSGYTGIAKNVAGATSEEINTVAAIGNTLMYYVSPIPRMDENLAAIRAIMERGGTSALPTTASAGWTDWQQQAMNNYQAIATNTAETVVRCERAAVACEAFAADIHRIIKVKGATQGINVFLNS